MTEDEMKNEITKMVLKFIKSHDNYVDKNLLKLAVLDRGNVLYSFAMSFFVSLMIMHMNNVPPNQRKLMLENTLHDVRNALQKELNENLN